MAKKNVAKNAALWSRVKSEAKAKFDVYPCVPLNSLTITKGGLESYFSLNLGQEILSYDLEKDELVWSPVKNIHYHESAPIVEIGKATGFKVRCTPDHKWVVNTGSNHQNKTLIKTSDINKHMQIVCCAELNDDSNLNIKNWSKKDSWTKNILSMSKDQREIFLASAIVYDGHDKGLSTKIENRHSFGFSQKNEDHFFAAILAAYLNGYHISFSDKYPDMQSATIIRGKRVHNTQNLIVEEQEDSEVWCPETETGTWVMVQNGFITITGNSAYANAWAAKKYKASGGTWKTVSTKKSGKKK